MKSKSKIVIISLICVLFLFMVFSIYNRSRVIREDRFFLSYTSPYHDMVKYIKTKNKGYIKWTSRIVEINSNNRLTLQAPNIPKVAAFFDYSAVKDSFKVGDLMTVSGIPYIGKIENNESSYYLKNARIEKSTNDDLKLFNETVSSNIGPEPSIGGSAVNNLSPAPDSTENTPVADANNKSLTPTIAPLETSNEIEYISEDFKEFNDSYDNLTDLQRDNISKDLRFRNVLWTGYVVDVNKTNITFSSEENSKNKAFIVYMSSNQKEAMLSINKKDKVTISGYILKCKGLAPWVVAGGKIEHP